MGIIQSTKKIISWRNLVAIYSSNILYQQQQ
jgi:hypothetical protein